VEASIRPTINMKQRKKEKKGKRRKRVHHAAKGTLNGRRKYSRGHIVVGWERGSVQRKRRKSLVTQNGKTLRSRVSWGQNTTVLSLIQKTMSKGGGKRGTRKLDISIKKVEEGGKAR